MLRASAIVLATAIACICIIYFSIPMQDTRQAQFDVILVLGNPANEDGSIGSVAKSRVLEAIRLYRAGLAPRLLMTGGAVKNRFVEAEVMRQFARSQGVADSAVLAEGASRNTLQNAYFSYKIMQAHDWTSALVVTSPTHVRRASLIFSHYPLAWRMHVAPWPDTLPLSRQAWFWISEAGYTSYGRLFGFPNERRYLPNTHFRPPQL
ncbi:MAG: YdcF family protein [Acidobacteriaceae bacterium]